MSEVSPSPRAQESAMDYRVISADDHIDMPWLPKDLWQTRVPRQWRERALCDNARELYKL